MNIALVLMQAVALLFSYDVNIQFYPGQHPESEIMIHCHGYGERASKARIVHKNANIPHHIISFNFPDAGCLQDNRNTLTFGTIQELLPLFAIIKTCVVDLALSKIHLYGFSAGGGAVINALAVLNTTAYDEDLLAIGITPMHKQLMLNAIQQGTIVLDCPLKSIEEIIALRGSDAQLELIAQQYRIHNLCPINSVAMLGGLHLDIVLYFQNPDTIISNRDDKLYYTTLLNTLNSSSRITFLEADEGGHAMYHPLLWNTYNELIMQ